MTFPYGIVQFFIIGSLIGSAQISHGAYRSRSDLHNHDWTVFCFIVLKLGQQRMVGNVLNVNVYGSNHVKSIPGFEFIFIRNRLPLALSNFLLESMTVLTSEVSIKCSLQSNRVTHGVCGGMMPNKSFCYFSKRVFSGGLLHHNQSSFIRTQIKQWHIFYRQIIGVI